MNSVILLTSIEPVPPTVSAALQPARLHYRLVDESVGRAGEPELRRQLAGAEQLSSDMDYGDTNALLNDLSSLPLGQESLADTLRIDGASMWQFVPSYIWPDVFRAVELTKVVLASIAAVQPSGIVSLRCGDRYDTMWHSVNRSVAEACGIAHSPASGSAGPGRDRPLALRPRGIAQATRRRRDDRRVDRLSRTWPGVDGSRKLLFTTLVRHWVADPDRPGHNYEEQLSPLLESLAEAGWDEVVAVDCPYNDGPALEALRERQVQTPGWVTWRSFGAHGGLSASERRALASRCRGWKRSFEAAAAEVDGGPAFRGVPMLPALHDVLARAVSSTLAGCAEMRAQARAMLEVERPAAVMASYETGPYARAVLIEAARSAIPTVALQHGMILDNHYDYMHQGVGPDPARDTFTIANTTCVWGPFWRRVLTETGHYPPATVRVTGNWRHARSQPEPERVESGRAALGIPPDLGLVLVCTAAQQTESLIHGLGSLRGAIDGVELRVRPHPSEEVGAIAAAYAATGGEAAHVSRNGELGDVLAASELVVSQLSTVISEAMLADRPVVIADFAKQAGWSAYKDSGACLVAGDPAEIVAHVVSVLTDRQVRDRLGEARARLIDEFFGGRDGEAPHRVVAALGR